MLSPKTTEKISDPRLRLLVRWLGEKLRDNELHVKPASADASFRRYFRVWSGGDTYIAMDAPPDKESCAAFVKIARLLKAGGLNAPHIYHEDHKQGFLLLTDFGTTDYLSKLNANSANALYNDAFDALLTIQSTVPTAAVPAYDTALLQNEMNLFSDWFLQRHLNIDISDRIAKVLEETCQLLIQNALQQPQVFVHRDYHSRNLMVCETNNPGLLDFQDAVKGPITYDLVSLLRDSYIAWPARQVKLWVIDYFRRLSESGLVDVDEQTFVRWFDWMGLQRQLKVAGIFARLYYRDGKAGYLNDIPLTYRYLSDTCARYSELAAFSAMLSDLDIAQRLAT